MTGWKYPKEHLKKYPYVAKVIRTKKLFVYVMQQLSSQENEMKIILISMLEVKDVNGMKAKKHCIIIFFLISNVLMFF